MMALFMAFGEPAKKEGPVETQFINLDQICFVNYFNPSAGNPEHAEIEITLTNNLKMNFAGKRAAEIMDAVNRRIV
jgi:hypothetical protein